MLKSEKKSLVRFLFLYLSSTFFIFALAGIMFYNYEKEHLLDKQKDILNHKAQKIKTQIRTLHNTFDKKLIYPTYALWESAIYDLDKKYIMGTFNEKIHTGEEKSYIENERLFYISSVEPYYLGAAYVLVTMEIDHSPMEDLKKSIYIFLLVTGIFFCILGFFLGKLFIAPMRESIEIMNRFIEDTTHELNTPISTILTNIEIIESSNIYEKGKELNRIEIASKTLSRIYDDLTYLSFNHKYHRNIEYINVSKIVHERVIYFSGMIDTKQLNLSLKIDDDVHMYIDKNDFIRATDNLISNAIKYNKLKGNLDIALTSKSFIVHDTGIGISQKEIKLISQRFKRANKSEGGFGIGLDIVNQVTTYYGYTLEIHSNLSEGTTMEIRWER